jgi:DNA-binding NarL/FixJ family response regulator
MTITVLLVEDHVVVRDGLRMLLEAQGDISVLGVAANGQEAVNQAQRLHPNVVVMDIAMPIMNGIDAAHLIHADNPNTRVVILSIHGTSEHIYRALQAGASGYLLKSQPVLKSWKRYVKFLQVAVT